MCRHWTSALPRNWAIASSCWGIARRTEAGIEQRVHPCMVPIASSIGRVDGVFNAVVAEGDFVGRSVFEGRGAGAGPTASAVVADLLDIAADAARRRSACLPAPCSRCRWRQWTATAAPITFV